MESADQAVAEVNRKPHQRRYISLNGPLLILIVCFFCLLSSQLNGTTVGDVHIKVSIARKQPMLDAATGKSVWASLGKLFFSFSIYRVCSIVLSFRT